MRSTMQDIRYALLSLSKAPGFSAIAILTLALGIAASTSTFSVVHAVLLRDLPFEEPDRLVVVWPEVNANKAMTLLAEERMASLEEVAGTSGWTLTLTGAGEPRELDGLLVSSDYFELLGVHPILGRSFRPDEELPGAAGVVVLSHHLWLGAFGADQDIVGQVIELGGAEYEYRSVIGVMPPGVEGLGRRVDAWIPLEGDPALALQNDESWYVNERIGRLAPGATVERAQDELAGYANEVHAALPGQISEEDVREATIRPLREHMTRNVREAVRAALGAAALVLLIGCFNVANLLLARGDARARDLAVRAALGAGRGRMTRMLFAESAILGLLGGTVGVTAATATLDLIVARAPESFPGIDTVAIDPAVLTFAVCCTLASTLIAGLIPAIRVGRAKATAALGGGARGSARSTGGGLSRALVSAQITLAVVVTVGSGLMLRSLGALMAVDPGIDGDGVVAVKPTPPAGRYPDGVAFLTYYEQVSERIASLPGVESVGGIHLLPGTSSNWSFPTYPEGVDPTPGEPIPSVNFRAVRGDYASVTRLPVVAGRFLEDADRGDTDPVVVVNQAFTDRFWPGEPALGKTLSIFSADGRAYTVVGVVTDVHQHGRELAPRPEMYFGHAQVPWDQLSMWLEIRVDSGDPMALTPGVREAIWSVDPDIPITDPVDLADALGQSTGTTRFITLLLSTFGVLALALCGVGVFGVTAYTSGRRRAEFGLRLALGSSRAHVVRSALSGSMAPVLVGLMLGLVLAVFTSGLLASALFSVTPSDPPTFLLVATVLTSVALLASVIPAWQVSRVDPVSVLGSD